MNSIDLCDGKYTLIRKDDGTLEALRYGELWRDRALIGDNLVAALFDEIVRLRGAVLEPAPVDYPAPEPSPDVRERFRTAIAGSESLWRSPTTLNDEQFQEILSRVLDAHATLIAIAPAEAKGDDRICRVCDGGPGNSGTCLCGAREYTPQPAGGEAVSNERIEAALDTPMGLDHTLRNLVRGDTMPVGYSKVDVVRALLTALGYTTAPAAPKINILCETRSNGIIGSTSLNVVRVSVEDDGSFTAVTDYWPPATQVQQNPCKCVDCGGDQPGHSDDCTYMADLHGHPAAGDKVRVTDEMVERAMEAAADACSRHIVCDVIIRAALEAVLAKPQEATNGS